MLRRNLWFFGLPVSNMWVVLHFTVLSKRLPYDFEDPKKDLQLENYPGSDFGIPGTVWLARFQV